MKKNRLFTRGLALGLIACLLLQSTSVSALGPLGVIITRELAGRVTVWGVVQFGTTVYTLYDMGSKVIGTGPSNPSGDYCVSAEIVYSSSWRAEQRGYHHNINRKIITPPTLTLEGNYARHKYTVDELLLDEYNLPSFRGEGKSYQGATFKNLYTIVNSGAQDNPNMDTFDPSTFWLSGGTYLMDGYTESAQYRGVRIESNICAPSGALDGELRDDARRQDLKYTATVNYEISEMVLNESTGDWRPNVWETRSKTHNFKAYENESTLLDICPPGHAIRNVSVTGCVFIGWEKSFVKQVRESKYELQADGTYDLVEAPDPNGNLVNIYVFKAAPKK